MGSNTCKLLPSGWSCNRKSGHKGPCAATKEPEVPQTCPICKGKGYWFEKKYMGVDCWDEPKYYDALRPCNHCTATIVTRVKRKGFA